MEESPIQNAISSEKELIEDKSAKAPLSDDDVIRIRKDKIIRLLKKDKFFSAFAIIGILSLLFSISIKFLNITYVISILSPKEWLVLAVLSFISAFLAYNKKYKLVFYPMLAWIVFLAVQIRTRNLPRLIDITTNTWTLGPDLDPFLFTRWSGYIVENGELFATDSMRYVPLGFNTKGELLLHPYLMAWFHKIAVFFGSDSITHSAILYPVFMFALTIIAFFLFTKKIFTDSLGGNKANIIALMSSLFFSIIPIFLPRTIAGIPEKESAAFLFLFLAFYFFLSAWKSQKIKSQIFLAILAGFSTAGMALIWGGYNFIFLTLAAAVFLSFILGNIDKNKLYIYSTWILSSFIPMTLFSTRYNIGNLVKGESVVILFIIAFHFLIFNTKLKKYLKSEKLSKIPQQFISIFFSIIFLFIIAFIAFGPDFIVAQFDNLKSNLVSPSSSRLILTVAENKQPFFIEWVSSFGPFFRNIPLLFWLFFIGSIHMFYKMVRFLKGKDRFLITLAYVIFLISVIFSRYSPDSSLNGTNTLSLFVFGMGFVIILFGVGFYCYKYNRSGESYKFKNIDFGLIMVLMLFLLCLFAARGAIRLVMMLVPPVSIIISYFAVVSFADAKNIKGDILKIVVWILAGIIIVTSLFLGYQFYKDINNQAAYYAPSIYTQQWQKAMSWVRENVPKDAVFGHWWDYGYWLQSIGERATVLDGGNAISYWNHFMGRNALTGTSNKEALEFLYAHNTTHFLIDSTDIGKYPAFSSIGSDINYDRRSWITTFHRDNSKVQETKNSTIYLYTGGTSLDEDIIHEDNGTRIFLPGGMAALGAMLVEKDSSGNILQPQGIFIYQEKQYRLPLRYASSNGELLDFNSGVEAGIFLIPRLIQDGEQVSIEKEGSLLFLSRRTVRSQLARLYLYREENPNFKLVHNEDDLFVAQVKSQDPEIGDILFFNELRGPVSIWEINYPADIEFKEEYLSTTYPEELQTI